MQTSNEYTLLENFCVNCPRFEKFIHGVGVRAFEEYLVCCADQVDVCAVGGDQGCNSIDI